MKITLTEMDMIVIKQALLDREDQCARNNLLDRAGRALEAYQKMVKLQDGFTVDLDNPHPS